MNLYEMAKRVAKIYDIKVENINYDFEDSNVEQYRSRKSILIQARIQFKI